MTAFSVWLDLHESDARSIVDADMDELSADASAGAQAFAVAGDAVTDAVKAPEFLDVDVEVTRRRAWRSACPCNR